MFLIGSNKTCEHIGTIEAFYVVRNMYKVAQTRYFVENIINKKLYETARAFHDLWSLVMF